MKSLVITALLASFVGLTPAAAMEQRRDRRDRYDDKWDDRRDERRANRKDKREDRREWREAKREAYWDAARYYRRDDRRYRPMRMGRNDRIYRGYDNRYYCRRDDGTTGLIVGTMVGAVLGNVIAPGGSKVLGTILGGGSGALIGRAIDDGDIVCR
jgi:hypothetical protein